MRIVREQRHTRCRLGARDDPIVRALAARARRDRHEQLGRFAAELPIQLGPKELGLPVARERPREVCERRRVGQGVVGNIGREIEQGVFDGEGRRGVDPRPEPRPEPAVDVLILVGPRPKMTCGRAVQPDRPDEPVVLEGALAEDLGEATG